MLKNRIIPCLDVKNGRVVKGINFVDLKDAGDPVEQASIYSDGGADEIERQKKTVPLCITSASVTVPANFRPRLLTKMYWFWTTNAGGLCKRSSSSTEHNSHVQK